MGFLGRVIAEPVGHDALRQGGNVGLVGQHKLLQEVSGDHGLLWGIGNSPEFELSSS